MDVNPIAGKPADAGILVDVDALVAAYFDGEPDPSIYVMEGLVAVKDRFDVVFACDTDHDRHGIVTRSAGLLPPNHYLAVVAQYLFEHRSTWRRDARVGKTSVTTQMIDRIAIKHGRSLYETPVGFKWFVEGLVDGTLGLGCEESAGASFLRRDGSVWTTDKDGIASALLAAEISARLGCDPGEIYAALTGLFGTPANRRIDAAATPAQKSALRRLTPAQIRSDSLAGERILTSVAHAHGNSAPLDGIKVSTENAWFAARPSGTENVYKIYAESFRGEQHLQRVLEEAQAIVDAVLADHDDR